MWVAHAYYSTPCSEAPKTILCALILRQVVLQFCRIVYCPNWPCPCYMQFQTSAYTCWQDESSFPARWESCILPFDELTSLSLDVACHGDMKMSKVAPTLVGETGKAASTPWALALTVGKTGTKIFTLLTHGWQLVPLFFSFHWLQ